MASKRKITVSSSSSRRSRSPALSERDDYPRQRPSVFSRLGTKRSPALNSSKSDILCRNILELGVCKFDTKCKYAHTHKTALLSRRSKRDRGSPSAPAPNLDSDWQNWNEESLDYEDEKMLEKKRLLLQRELAKEDSDPESNSAQDQANAKQKKNPVAMMIPSSVLNNAIKAENVAKKPSPLGASTTSTSSSSSSDSASSSSGSNSSGDEQPASKKMTSKKVKSRDSSSSSYSQEETPKKKLLKKKLSKKKLKGQVSKKGKKLKTRKTTDKKKPSLSKKKNLEKRKSSPTRGSSDQQQSIAEAKPQPVIRKGLEVDKFGFYHAQPIQSSASQEGTRHGESSSSKSHKRSISSDRRGSSPQPHKRKRRSSGSSPTSKKRRSSPPPSSSKSKLSYVAATASRSTVGKDRDLRETAGGGGRNWKQRSSMSPPRSRDRAKKKGSGGQLYKKAQVSGANAVNIDAIEGSSGGRSRSGNNRRTSSPGDRGLRRNRSSERLLPPQALQQKNPAPKRPSSSDRSSNKTSHERSLKSSSPQLQADKSEERDLSAAEDFSDIGESDEEILNQEPSTATIEEDPKSEPEAAIQESKKDSEHESDQDMKENEDLLEGISEEELDVSDDDKEDKVKVADALGVDWSQLITPKATENQESKANDEKSASSFRKYWSPSAIISRMGLPTSILKPEFCQEIMADLNEKQSENEEKLDVLHPIALIHAHKKSQQKLKENQDESKSGQTWWQQQHIPSWQKPNVKLDIY